MNNSYDINWDIKINKQTNEGMKVGGVGRKKNRLSGHIRGTREGNWEKCNKDTFSVCLKVP